MGCERREGRWEDGWMGKWEGEWSDGWVVGERNHSNIHPKYNPISILRHTTLTCTCSTFAIGWQIGSGFGEGVREGRVRGPAGSGDGVTGQGEPTHCGACLHGPNQSRHRPSTHCEPHAIRSRYSLSPSLVNTLVYTTIRAHNK